MRILALLIALCVSAITLAAPGPLQVTEIPWLTLHDAARNRDLSMSLCIPQAPGPFPLVVFSHGAYASAQDVIAIGRFWASHGYVVILPTHADSFTFTTRSDENDPWSGPHDFGEYGRPTTQGTWKPIWTQRPRDIRFILDSLDTLEQRVPQLKGASTASASRRPAIRSALTPPCSSPAPPSTSRPAKKAWALPTIAFAPSSSSRPKARASKD